MNSEAIKEKVNLEVLSDDVIKITNSNRSITAHISYFLGAVEVLESLDAYFEEESYLYNEHYNDVCNLHLGR